MRMRTFKIITPNHSVEMDCEGMLLACLTAQHLSELDGHADLINISTYEILRQYNGGVCTYCAMAD